MEETMVWHGLPNEGKIWEGKRLVRHQEDDSFRWKTGNRLLKCQGKLDQALSNLCSRPGRKAEGERGVEFRFDEAG